MKMAHMYKKQELYIIIVIYVYHYNYNSVIIVFQFPFHTQNVQALTLLLTYDIEQSGLPGGVLSVTSAALILLCYFLRIVPSPDDLDSEGQRQECTLQTVSLRECSHLHELSRLGMGCISFPECSEGRWGGIPEPS